MTDLESALIPLPFILFFAVVYYFNKYYREADKVAEYVHELEMSRGRIKEVEARFSAVELERTKAVADLQKIRNIVNGKGSF